MPLLSLLLLLAPPPDASVPATLRLDYVHSGSATGETYALDGLALEGPWPGNPARAIDDSGLGKYRFEVKDAASGRLLYSRGFASVYGEWETTGEAKELARSFGESLRFPLPAARARVSISKRGECSSEPPRSILRRRNSICSRCWALNESSLLSSRTCAGPG